MIKVLVVDDSSFMRNVIAKLLSLEEDIIVIGTAANGEDCLVQIPQLNPDVILLDIRMPILNGIDALKEIVSRYKIPTIMVSGISNDDADIVFKTLEIGAVDFISKPGADNLFDIFQYKAEFVNKIKSAYNSTKPNVNRKKKKKDKHLDKKIVNKKFHNIIFGVSTGGPILVNNIIENLKFNRNITIFIVQHMPEIFTKKFADRINGFSEFTVKESENLEVIKRGYIYIAAGGKQTKILPKTHEIGLIKIDDKPNTIHKPSIDVTMTTSASVFRDDSLGIILTGMGKDGTKGVREIKKFNGTIIAQKPETCIIPSMPTSIIESELYDYIFTPQEIIDFINKI